MGWLDPDTGTVSSSTVSDLNDDPIVAVAYYCETMYYYNSTNPSCPAHLLYLLTESGDLYTYGRCVLTAGTSKGTSLVFGLTKVASTGLSLADACTPDSGAMVSMVYDADSEILFLSTNASRTDGEPTAAETLYAIDPSTGTYAVIGESDGLYSCLYQYERAEDLTVQMLSDDAEIYERETVQLSARVLPTAYQETVYKNQVTWSSSDEAVAAVDENGLVSGIGEGTATITATSADADESGNHASASVTVTVTAVKKLSKNFSALLTTEAGSYWSEIDGSDARLYTLGTESSVTLLGAAGPDSSGMIYAVGTEDDGGQYLYRIDSSNGYTADRGAAVSWERVGGAAQVPEAQFEAENSSGETVTVSAFGFPAFTATQTTDEGTKGYLEMIADYETGETVEVRVDALSAMNSYFSGLAYAGTTYDENGIPTANLISGIVGTESVSYGRELLLKVTPAYDADTDTVTYSVSYAYARLNYLFGSAYNSLSMDYYNDGTEEGLLIAAVGSDATEFWFVNLTLDNWVNNSYYSPEYLGTASGVTDAVGLYTASEPSSGTAESVAAAFALRGADEEYGSSWIPMDTTIEKLMEAYSETAESVVTYTDGSGMDAQNSVESETVAETGLAETAADLAITETAGSDLTAGTGSGDAINEAAGSMQSISIGSQSVLEENMANLSGGTSDSGSRSVGTQSLDSSVAEIDISEEDESRTVTLTLTEEQTVSNGWITVTYDTGKLAYAGLFSPAQYAVNVDEENGEIQFAYATAGTISAGSAIAEFTFTCTAENVHTDISLQTGERNQTFDLTEESKIPVADHAYEAEATDPTCTEEGSTTYTCSICGDTYTETIAATGHDYVETVISATCTAGGKTEHKCSTCGNLYYTDLTSATGHTWDDGVATTEATCTMEGVMTYTCTSCHDT